MSKQIAAIYEGGVIRPLEPPRLTEGEELDVVLLPRQERARESQPAHGSFDAKLAAMQEAIGDELFLADMREAMEDFSHADAEETPA
jgi:predicted DNA-binding antitoxin AbrB/MazE fold protein